MPVVALPVPPRSGRITRAQLAEMPAPGESATAPAVVRAADLDDRRPRTLLYGYTVSRRTWHLYLDDGGAFTMLVCGAGLDPTAGAGVHHRWRSMELIDVAELLPRDGDPVKRLYPESADAEFFALVVAAGVRLPFTAWDDARAARLEGVDFHGER